ncbi:hypothetical protein [Thalassobacillus sp. B23F22_16]|uniref:hypothetical protein n=1 Tax=Thalassobacillus sp. B23F22_16 TaxID=3459513 RepID=UPI00373FA3AC
MKKFLIVGLAVILSLTPLSLNFPTSVFAQLDDQRVEVSKKDKIWLEGFGFSEQEINSMSKTSLHNIKEQFKGVNGTVKSSKTEYFKVKVYKENGKTKSKMIKKSKKEALEAVEKIKEEKKKNNPKSSFIETNSASAAYDTENDGWITQTLSVSYLSNGEYLAKTSYNWLQRPGVGFQDAIGITHGNNVDKISGSEFAEHSYRDGLGRHYEFDYSADKKNYYGYGDKFDLKVVGTNEGAYDHQGFMYFKFKRNLSSSNTADLYGHYAHALTSSYFSISLSYGGLSLSGAGESNATDTHVDLTY